MKWLPLLLVLPMVLSGCAGDPDPDVQSTSEPINGTDPAGIEAPTVNDTVPVNDTEEPEEVAPPEPEEPEPEVDEEEEVVPEPEPEFFDVDGFNFLPGELRHVWFQMNDTFSVAQLPTANNQGDEAYDGVIVIVPEEYVEPVACSDAVPLDNVFIYRPDGNHLNKVGQFDAGRYHLYFLHEGSEEKFMAFNISAEQSDLPTIVEANGTFRARDMPVDYSSSPTGSTGSARMDTFSPGGLVGAYGRHTAFSNQMEMTLDINDGCAKVEHSDAFLLKTPVLLYTAAVVPWGPVSIAMDTSSGANYNEGSEAGYWSLDF